ncbi:putative RNA-directed DNA polymerase from transposon X-element, partial [Trichonephila clavipes]
VRYFHVRIGHSSSHKFMQDQGVPLDSVLSATLFNIHMSSILNHLPPSVRGRLYVDDLQVSCQGSDMRLIERKLQTTVNRLVKWCDQNGHTISPSKSSCFYTYIFLKMTFSCNKCLAQLSQNCSCAIKTHNHRHHQEQLCPFLQKT